MSILLAATAVCILGHPIGASTDLSAEALAHCMPSDIVWMQVTDQFPPNWAAATVCDFSQTVLIEPHSNPGWFNVTCVFQGLRDVRRPEG